VGIFSRKQHLAASSTSPSTAVDIFIGRKFRSSLSMQECLDAFSIVKDTCYPTDGPLRDVEWRMPADLGPFESSQGSVPGVPPSRVVTNDLVRGGGIYLALWDGMVSYGEGGGKGGPPCEMWFVPPGFDTSPISIAGTWKMRDSSLSSIGYVESPLWGAVT
jgi:hypothetical protein